MYRVSIELYKHEWKFGRTRNAVGTRAVGECFHRFFEFSQTCTSVCITRQKQGVHVFYSFQKTTRREKGKLLVNFDYQNVNSLCSRHHYVYSARQFCVSIELYKLDCTTQPSTTQHDAMQYNTIRYDTIQCDAIRYHTI